MDSQQPAAGYPSHKRSWYMIGLLSAMFVLSYIDRYMLPLLAAPVAHDLQLTDVQLGLLLGLGFAVLFSIAGIPLAALLDRGNRILILSVCVLAWSASTVLSAFSNGFWWLLFCRSGIALGEAVLFPAAISLVADLFQPSERRRPLTVISTIAALMGGGSFFLGAAAVSIAEALQHAGVAWPVWRISLVLVGLPGIVLAMILLATARDPERHRPSAVTVAAVPVMPFLRKHWRFYLPYFLGLGLTAAIALGTVSWVPALLSRAYGMPTTRIGYLFGLTCLIPALIGTPVWSALSGRIDRGRHHEGPIVCLLLGATLMTIGAIAVPFVSAGATFPIIAVVLFGCATLVVLPALIVHAVDRGNMHARLVALNLFATSTIGLVGGPLAVPLIAKRWPGDPFAIGYGLSTFSACAGTAAIVAFYLARFHYRTMGLKP